MADDNDKSDELKYTDVGLRRHDPRAARTEEGIENPQGRFVGELDKKYESIDVGLRPIVLTAVVVIGMVVASYLILFGMFQYWGAREAKNNQPDMPIMNEQMPVLEGERLQPFPDMSASGDQAPDYGKNLNKTEVGDYILYKNQEALRAEGYGWVDQPKGLAKVPVDDAIEVIAAKGMPTGEAWQMKPGMVMVQGVVMTSDQAAAQMQAMKNYAQRQGMEMGAPSAPGGVPQTTLPTAQTGTQAPQAAASPGQGQSQRGTAAGAAAGTQSPQGRP